MPEIGRLYQCLNWHSYVGVLPQRASSAAKTTHVKPTPPRACISCLHTVVAGETLFPLQCLPLTQYIFAEVQNSTSANSTELLAAFSCHFYAPTWKVYAAERRPRHPSPRLPISHLAFLPFTFLPTRLSWGTEAFGESTWSLYMQNCLQMFSAHTTQLCNKGLNQTRFCEEKRLPCCTKPCMLLHSWISKRPAIKLSWRAPQVSILFLHLQNHLWYF